MKKINGDLTFDEMSSVMSEILNGKNSDEEIAEFLRDLSKYDGIGLIGEYSVNYFSTRHFT